MKILLLAKGYPPTIGGVENYSYYIAEGLGFNHEVEVLTFGELRKSPKKINDKNANVSRLNYSDHELLNGWRMLKALRKKLSEFPADVIIATTWKIGLPYSFLKFKYNIPFVLVAHGAEIARHRNRPFLMKLMQFVLSKTNLIITVSNFTNKIVHKYSSESDKKVCTVSNGINLDSIQPIKLERARTKLEISHESSVLLTVSRLDARKGHAKVIELLPELTKKYPKLLYLIVGDGPNRENLEELSNSLGLTESVVKFIGFIPDEELPIYYSAADVFIMLNEMKSEEDFEGFGFVFAEAGAYGKPVIGGDNAGPKEVIDHQKTGYLLKPNSKKEILAAIQDLFDNEKKRIQMGQAARKKVLEQFTLDVMISKFEEKLHSIF